MGENDNKVILKAAGRQVLNRFTEILFMSVYSSLRDFIVLVSNIEVFQIKFSWK